jgi:phosphoglycolate phosphatase-like HAD superfamily hydrolase
MKLLLFDLDGTVLRATRGAEPFHRALREIFGIVPEDGAVRFDGKTDPAIIAELLAHAGAGVQLDVATLRAFEERLAQRLDEALISGVTRVDPTPGVRTVLEALAARSEFALAVLTGNLERSARLKLSAAGLAGFFATGAFGSDHAERAALPDVARARFHAATGCDVPRERCVIVGDTPLDHAAAAANGIPCLLVASGRTPYAELAALAPGATFADWTDAAAIERTLEAL